MPVVTISASYGAGGSRVGPAVAHHLGCDFVDRAIPVEVAARLAVPVEQARVYDDTALTGLVGVLARMPNMSGVMVPDADSALFQRETERLITEAADHGDVVLLGRAAALVLGRRPGALHVRLDGPEDARLRQAMRIEEIDNADAKRRMREVDRARTAYVKHFYGCDPRALEHYHLVIDSTALPLAACVELIASATAATGTTAPGHHGPSEARPATS